MKRLLAGAVLLAMLVVGAVVGTVVSPALSQAVPHWQYKSTSWSCPSDDCDTRKLNELGGDGWELVQVVTKYTLPTYIFRKPAP